MYFDVDLALVEEDLSMICCFLFQDDALLVKENQGAVQIPSAADVKQLGLSPENAQYVGRMAGYDCFTAGLQAVAASAKLPPDFSFVKLRQLFGRLSKKAYPFALRAFHLQNWARNNRFCGRCGNQTNVLPHELAVKCSSCGHIVYPRISPAIIVAVTKGDQILLARSNRFPPGRYSVIAGFLEPGETLEECVQREVMEEVGLEVADIQYVGNQPWPFPDSQMIGFTARHVRGDIAIDNMEIVAADWFSADNLPDIPPKDSIARQLIDGFVRHASRSVG